MLKNPLFRRRQAQPPAAAHYRGLRRLAGDFQNLGVAPVALSGLLDEDDVTFEI